MEALKKQRANIRRNITRIKNVVDVEKTGKLLTSSELKCRLSILEAYFTQILQVQSSIEELDPDDKVRDEVEDLYVTTKSTIQDQLFSIEGSQSPAPHQVSFMPQCSTYHKIPVLDIPPFDGKYSEYKNFITSFSSIIDTKSSLSNVEKFNHLLNCLKGQALATVKTFQVTNENYAKALARLKERYDNNTLIFLENIDSLFNLPTVQKPTCVQLRALIDNAAAIYDSLQSLGSNKDITQAILISFVMQKSDAVTKKKWKESLDYHKLPQWVDCVKLFEKRAQDLSSGDIERVEVFKSKSTNQHKPSRDSYSFSVTSRSCSLCRDQHHALHACSVFKAMELTERFNHVKRLGLCINCLSSDHQVANCKSQYKCKVCKKSHHSLLHRFTPTSLVANQSIVSTTSNTLPIINSESTKSYVHTHTTSAPHEQIILATAIVLVKNSSGAYVSATALLDSCSQINLMTEECAQRLRLNREKHNMKICGIGNAHTHTNHRASTVIKSRHYNTMLPLEFCITPQISYQPETEINISSWKLPANTPLADELFFKSKRIDLLIGTDVFFELLSVGQIKLGRNLPILQKTLLGWVVSGKCTIASTFTTQTMATSPSIDQSIDYNLQLLWKLDNVEYIKPKWTTEQDDCETYYQKTVRRDTNGQIIVQLPFKLDPDCLGHSKDIAMRRFIAQERRLSRTPDLKNQYISFMREYQDLGHMARVEHIDLKSPHYYIPHHYVLKLSSTSTKLRVVFDASCRTSSQKSLNDILMVGPTIQDDLFLLLLRFRLFKYALTADIVKMYRQFMVDPTHRKFQLILWRETSTQELHTYQLNTVTYGTGAAPFLAVRSLHFLADQYATTFKVGSQILKSSFYVDDLLCGADTVEELHTIQTETSAILETAGMQLAKWHSNHEYFINDETVKDLSYNDEAVTSTLGIKWAQLQDAFLFSFDARIISASTTTKRSILSLASSLFDPLGLLSPLLIVSKIIMQELWLLKLNWDESVPQTLYTSWNTFLNDLKTLTKFSIPRYCLTPNIASIQIHGFADASIRAYGCCIYIRTQDTNGNVQVRLFASKSRVAPMKKRSLPQLELCGGHLLCKLYDKIQSLFKNKGATVFLWTDSQLVLYWLQRHSATLSTFVGNRISEMQELSANCHWRHVPTKMNPADIVSRGCTVQELSASIWINGPLFLRHDCDQWPETNLNAVNKEDIKKEQRKSTFTISQQVNEIVSLTEKFSSLTKILRITAWLLRFTQLKQLKQINDVILSDTLDSTELDTARSCVIHHIQQQYFAEVLQQLRKRENVRGAVKMLAPFIDSTGKFEILRVGGRLQLSQLPENAKHPALLPNNCAFVSLLFRHLHFENYHAGPKALVAISRQQVWVINARLIARRIVNSCVHCNHYKPKLFSQIMGNLPAARVTPSRPFCRCAVDFFGPMNTYLRIRGKGPIKTYGAIFVCLATKAVHIEVVSDLSTEAFIAALKRLIGRRGLPTDIFCDNATNFTGANNKLQDLKHFLFDSQNQKTIINFCLNDFINFQFIPPRAPHFGGLWEAAVKSTKNLLYRTLQNARLTYEELNTALIDIEAILNSRPLTALSSDPNDFEALTPGHFIIGGSLKSLPEDKVADKDIEHLERWSRISAIKQRFWQRWSAEYISELQSRSKWCTSMPNVVIGTLVLIHEDNVPPLRWTLGRIVATIPGKDNIVRVVDVITSKGIIRRAIHKLAPLLT